LEFLFHAFRWLHIAAGFLALLIFWVPIVSKKGGRIHNRSGWVYVYAMAFVSVSAFYMGVYRIVWDPARTEDTIPFAWFLIFIALLSGASAWYGIRVLTFKRRSERHRSLVDFFFPLLLLGSSISISVYGFIIDFGLLKYFPLIGFFVGITQLIYWLSAPKLKMHWMIEHLTGMLACCIATITAFTVFGAPRLLQIESVSLILWILPTLLIVPLIIGFSNYYKKKYNTPKLH
jgi:hypothetical protein